MRAMLLVTGALGVLVFAGCADDKDGGGDGATDDTAAAADDTAAGDDGAAADETCDGSDDDGDGAVDEGFGDADNDGIADCVDSETCDERDNDGDGAVDEGYDADGDGYYLCGDEGYVDCDDGNAGVNPGAEDVPGNDVDNDCDGRVDEGQWAGGEVVITEVMAAPEAVSDAVGEWFEVYNASGEDLRLDGMTVTTQLYGQSYTFSGELTMAPGELLVFGADGSVSDNGNVVVDRVYSGLSINSDTDGLTLWMGDTVLDEVIWGDGWYDRTAEGASLTLDPLFLDAVSNDRADVWCAAPETWGLVTDLGSPGEPNPECPSVDHDGDDYSYEDGDCDDADPAISPAAPEICGDEIDNNCNNSQDGCGLSGEVELADGAFDGAVHGDISYDYVGYAVDGAGDVDGDGYGDLITGAYGAGSGGAAYLIPGPITGESQVSDSGYYLYAGYSSENAGYAVSGAGDVDNDGYDDVLVGAYYSSAYLSYAGTAYLVMGPVTADMSLSTADAAFYGEVSSDYAGVSVGGGGDVDSDGFDDVLVGAYYADPGSLYSAGAVYLIYGPATNDGSLSNADARFSGGVSYAYAGWASDLAGDTNGDGFDDVIIGAYGMDVSGGYDNGQAYVMLGPVTGEYDLSADADATMSGEVSYDYFGYSVSKAGDVDGDGYGDVLVGAYGNDERSSAAGKAYLLLGPLSGTVDVTLAEGQYLGITPSDYAGRDVADAGDVDGDGRGDVVVGLYGADPGGLSGAGLACLMYGPATGTINLEDADARIKGALSGDAVGISVGGGDVSGDGLSDLLIGAYGTDPASQYSAGSVYIVNGARGW